MKRRAQSPLLDERPQRHAKTPRKTWRGDNIRDTQLAEPWMSITKEPSMSREDANIDPGEPMSQVSYGNGRTDASGASQDINDTGMAERDAKEPVFANSQTDDEYSQTENNQVPSYRNKVLDMSTEWAQRWFRHDIEGAEVFYQPELIPIETANAWYEELNALDTWYQPTLTVHGRPVLQPRSIAAYVVDPSIPRPKYSNHKVVLHHPYPPMLQHIQDLVSQTLGVGFDHVMLNRYASGEVGIGKHRDTKENQVIAVLSLGAERTFVMTPHVSKGVPKVQCGDRKWVLGNGSLLVMQGDTQDNWKHEVPKEPKIRGGRISLTFRQLVHE